MNDTLILITKFVLAVLLFPIAWATAVVFHEHIDDLPRSYDEFINWGMFAFLMVYLFFYRFKGVYAFGQRMVAGLFQFLSPMHHFLSRVIPFYLVVILGACFVTRVFLKTGNWDFYFMFFAGFSFIMHLVLTSEDLQEQEQSFIKPAYLFFMVTVAVVVLCLTVLLLDLALGDFTFPDFARSVIKKSADVYHFSGKKLIR